MTLPHPYTNVRPSPIAGRWYPGEAHALARLVDGYLDQAGPPPAEGHPEVVGLLAPHAGLIYSGPVAAYAYQWVRGQTFDCVAVLSPSHFHDDGPVVTSACAVYATPLGRVPVDQPLLAELRWRLAKTLQLPPESALPALRHDREHAVEIELPFLQQVLAPGFQLVPLMLRDQTAEVAGALGACLADLLAGRRALLVASSDLSHYRPQPAAVRLDHELLRQLETFDPAALLAADASGRGQACGVGALAAVLWAARALGARTVRVLRHATSGDVSGDYDAVVGYAAAVFLK